MHYLKRLIGDVVLVQHIEKSIESDTLIIPDNISQKAGAVIARVIEWGIVPFERRNIGRNKDKKFFVCDELEFRTFREYIKVIVPTHLGTRNLFKDYPDYILYDGEDILAIIEE